MTKRMSISTVFVVLMAGNAQAQHHDTGETLWSQADAYYDPEEMAKARAGVLHHSGGEVTDFIMADRMEWQLGDEGGGLWDLQAWRGGDLHKLWIKTEGEYSFDHQALEEMEIQALYSRAILAYFDLQMGLRYDLEPKGKTHGVLGIQGLMPYGFEVDLAGFIATSGDVSMRFEGEYDFRLTQRLIAQPRLELSWQGQDDLYAGLGSGFTHTSIGLRVRYEITREFAPYIGLEWQSDLGETRDLIRRAGGEAEDTKILIGHRSWY
ncbi:copper resistance protein B [Woodsholea maritima]|uniref:copper resistance protein B n=1 Tax=Woodsholea maritima TaxID=240237 RepID=UPI0003680FE3|nr:copper resistance protein B [Woodsholea maritima]